MLVVPAYAKVNLALEVTGRRPDGWHDIATVIATIDWHDLVDVAVTALPDEREGASVVHLSVSGPFSEGVPADATNLAARAARHLLRLAGDPPLAVTIHLGKEVPSAAGLGGGSADAAAVLRAGATLLASQPAAEDLATAAEELGSDVPALLAGGTLLATGRGEHIHPLPTPALDIAVAVAGASATGPAYAALLDDERIATGRATALAAALQRDPRAPLDDELLGSALEPSACRAAPGLRDSLARLRALTPGHPWHLTGSGGAAFAVARDRAAAEELASTARAAGFPARACRTVAAAAR